MNLNAVREESSSRFQEAQNFLRAIKAAESRFETPDLTNSQKGSFLVLLYGVFEYALTRTLTETADLINAHSVQYGHLNEAMYVLALDPQLRSLQDSGRKTKWERRHEIFRVQVCSDPVKLPEEAFLTDTQNVWAATVERMFRVFGTTSTSLYDQKVRQYIDEVVERRNAVAHGRESASTVGRQYTSSRLQRLFDELNRQTQYMLAVFDEHIKDKGFVKLAHRDLYT